MRPERGGHPLCLWRVILIAVAMLARPALADATDAPALRGAPGTAPETTARTEPRTARETAPQTTAEAPRVIPQPPPSSIPSPASGPLVSEQPARMPFPSATMPSPDVHEDALSPDDPALVDRSHWLLLSDSVEQADRERALLRDYGLQLRGRTVYTALGMVVTRLVLGQQAQANPDNLLARIHREQPTLVLEFDRHYLPLQDAPLAVRLRTARASPERYGQVLVGLTDHCRQQTVAVSLALLDGRVNTALAAFAGVDLQVMDVTGRQPPPSDHATAIAALLVGQGDYALLPGASLLAITVFAPNDRGQLRTRTEWLLAGLEQVANRRPVPLAANLSLGGPESVLLTKAFARVARHTLLVGAAGNESAAAPVFPARLPEVLAVTAVDPDGRLYDRANRGDGIALAAPGVDIYSIDAAGRPTYVTGTSFAAPWVVAALARAAAHVGGEDRDRWRQSLYAAALDLGAPGPDRLFGYGLVDFGPVCGAR